MSIFQIKSDISLAQTLLSEFYISDKYFENSKEKIFAKSWQFITTIEEVNNIKPQIILEGFLNEPVLVTKKADKIKCLSNVCTHRGKILIENKCKSDGIRCGYHGRRFDLDGNFLSMPEFEGVKDFPTERDSLANIPFDVWKNFIFASLNPTAPLDEFITEMKETTRDFDFENLEFVSTKTYEVKAHWALYCENYLEGFHIPFVHKSLNEVLDYGNYTTETFRYSVLQTGYDDNGEIVAHYFFIFPNLMFNFYPWGISVNIVKPIKKDLTKVEYFTFVNDESKKDIGAGTDLETVELEDQAVVESVQKGLKSRFYKTGRYSPTREQGTHHFHRLIVEFFKR